MCIHTYMVYGNSNMVYNEVVFPVKYEYNAIYLFLHYMGISYLAFKFLVKVKNKSQNYMKNFGNTRISFVGQVLLLKVLLQLWSFLNHSKPG